MHEYFLLGWCCAEDQTNPLFHSLEWADNRMEAHYAVERRNGITASPFTGFVGGEGRMTR